MRLSSDAACSRAFIPLALRYRSGTCVGSWKQRLGAPCRRNTAWARVCPFLCACGSGMLLCSTVRRRSQVVYWRWLGTSKCLRNQTIWVLPNEQTVSLLTTFRKTAKSKSFRLLKPTQSCHEGLLLHLPLTWLSLRLLCCLARRAVEVPRHRKSQAW